MHTNSFLLQHTQILTWAHNTMHQQLSQDTDDMTQPVGTFCIRLFPLKKVYTQFLVVIVCCTLQIASRISPKMKFGPLSRPFLQVPIMSLAQKVIVSEPGHEPQFEGRTEEGAALYQAILDDDGELQLAASLLVSQSTPER